MGKGDNSFSHWSGNVIKSYIDGGGDGSSVRIQENAINSKIQFGDSDRGDNYFGIRGTFLNSSLTGGKDRESFKFGSFFSLVEDNT